MKMMTGAGRPLRFLLLVLGMWLGARMLMLGFSGGWSMDPASRGALFQQRALRDHGGPRPAGVAASGPDMSARLAAARSLRLPPPPLRRSGGGAALAHMGSGWSNESAEMMLGAAMHFLAPRRATGLFGRLTDTVADSPGLADALVAGPDGLPATADGRARRWSLAAWLLWRPDVAAGFAQAPLLGGSQAGARLDYRLGEGRLGRLAAYARLGRALTGPSAEEGAIGLAWRPGRLPVSLLAERRQRLGPGGRSGLALMAAGGAGPRDVAPRIEAEGYAQAGLVGAPGLDGFADGKASLGYRLAAAGARHDLTLGAGISGSAQPGAGRLDVGPELRLRLPFGTGAMRLSTEWRERIAGDARPARGPAVTLIAVF